MNFSKMTPKEIRSLFKPGDRVVWGIVWLTNETPPRRVTVRGTFSSWDESYRATPFRAFLDLDEPHPQSGEKFVNVDCRELNLISALDRLAEEA